MVTTKSGEAVDFIHQKKKLAGYYTRRAGEVKDTRPCSPDTASLVLFLAHQYALLLCQMSIRLGPLYAHYWMLDLAYPLVRDGELVLGASKAIKSPEAQSSPSSAKRKTGFWLTCNFRRRECWKGKLAQGTLYYTLGEMFSDGAFKDVEEVK